MSDEEIKDRITRLEERLVAERSVRKTRDDQMFKRFEEFSAGLDEVSETQTDMTLKLQAVEQAQKQSHEDHKEVEEIVKANTAVLQSIDGSIKTAKWLWPLFMVILSALITLFVQNVTNEASQTAETAVKDQLQADPPSDPETVSTP